MGATAAYRVPKRVADRTCTQVWTWITNKCRRRINQGEGYIYIYIYHIRDLTKKEAPEKQEELGIHILGRGVLSP